MFDAAKTKFRDVRFEVVNVDDQSKKYLSQKYNVKGIPKLVLLGERDKVLYNGGAPGDLSGLEGLIKRFHD